MKIITFLDRLFIDHKLMSSEQYFSYIRIANKFNNI